MAGKNNAAFGIYPTRADVERAVDALRSEGFRNTDISILYPINEGSKDFAHIQASKAPEGATTGAVTGAALGGALGWLAGIGMPEYEAKRYEGRVKNGGILLSVHCDDSDWTKKAKKIMENTGGKDI